MLDLYGKWGRRCKFLVSGPDLNDILQGIHERRKNGKGDDTMEKRAKRQPKVTEAEQLSLLRETLQDR